MRIPKHIERALIARYEAAVKLAYLDEYTTGWLEKNNIELDPADYNGGVELYSNPTESLERIFEAIKNKKS